MNKNPTILFLGDSITEGVAASKEENIYSSVCCKLLSAKRVSYGLTGSRIAEQKIPKEGCERFDVSFFQRAQLMQENADLVVVFGGTNDFGHGDAKMGDIHSTSLYTFYGACKNLYLYLINKYGKEKILIVLPLHTAWDDSVHGELRTAKKEVSPTLFEYVKAINEVASLYKLKVVDPSDALGVPESTNNGKIFTDGLHPNDEGHRILGHLLADFIENNF